MVINEKANEIYKFFILEVTFFSIKFGGTVFVGVVFVGTLYFRIVFVTFIISSQLITESPVILIIQ